MKAFRHLFLFAVAMLVCSLFAAVALAQVALPDVDPVQQLFLLISSLKVASPLAIGIIAVVFVGEVIKKFVGDDFKYKRLLIVVLSSLYGVFLAVSHGAGVADAIVATMITGGGASALYEALKGVGFIKSSPSPALPPPAAQA